MKVGQAIQAASLRLAEAGIGDARREARILALHVLGHSMNRVLDADQDVDEAVMQALVARRAAREPLAFITGRRGFWTVTLEVSRATLIPRADSEALIEAALAAFPDRVSVGRILDLGTGTGCLLLAALSEFPAAFGVGIDVSPDAAILAARNASTNGLAERCGFAAGDWSSAVFGRFDLILCNPPYIRSGDIQYLMPDVAAYEPLRALDGGEDGLAAYRKLLSGFNEQLAPGGAAVLELGFGQADPVAALAEKAGLHYLGARDDLAGVPRALMVCRRGDAEMLTKKLFGSTAVGS